MARNDSPRANPTSALSRVDFAAVVNEHWTGVYRLLHRLTGNSHDTDDLTQETFLRALNRLETFQAGTNLRAWLLRIASNAFFDLQRKRQSNRQQPLPDDAVSPERPPGQALETGEQGRLLRIALEELSETARLVFHLRVEEELSFREIADILGGTEEAARWHMHQARGKLLKRLSALEKS
ncbi:MAG: sigma-70 family RNA polymerase sigma factor [Planctomycetia bacterium]|nr:sigma-70 family RNA polymerase sigma factor [Planctomycetia bacterium]